MDRSSSNSQLGTKPIRDFMLPQPISYSNTMLKLLDCINICGIYLKEVIAKNVLVKHVLDKEIHLLNTPYYVTIHPA